MDLHTEELKLSILVTSLLLFIADDKNSPEKGRGMLKVHKCSPQTIINKMV